MIKMYFNTRVRLLRTLTSISLCFLSISSFAQIDPKVKQILDGVNHYRLLHLRAPLKLNEKMCQIAATHSHDMAKKVCPFGHSGWDKRFANIRRNVPNSMQAGENVAYGYKDIESVVKGWMNSSGHRANILGHYNLTGIAIAYDERHRPYYTQIFAYQENSSNHHTNQVKSTPKIFGTFSHQLSKLF